ncbi:MAG: helix-turn-helix domain-containing protein [Janthinobacterium lividum]
MTNTRNTSNLKILSIQLNQNHAMKHILSLSKQLGPLLQSARKSAGMSQTALAQRLGISQSRVSAMELDPASISVEQLLALLAALNHEVLVQPKQGAAVVSDDAGAATPEW